MSSNATNPRYWAWKLLAAVWGEAAYGNLAWPRLLAQAQLAESDRRLATEMGYGALRHWGQLIAIVEVASDRKADQLDPEVIWVLALGTYQLLHMRIPAHAAVNETVELAVKVGLRSTRGLVNAVLRRVSQRPLEGWLDELTTQELSPEELFALKVAHPSWIVREVARSLSREQAVDELPEALLANNSPAEVTLALLPGLETPADGERVLTFSPIGVYRAGNPTDDSRVRSGRARVQDEGSQLAALIAARSVPLNPGDLVADACAGPGGKAAVLAAEAILAGAHFTAIDRSEHRAELVRESLQGLVAHQDSWQVICADAEAYFDEVGEGRWDRILLDAPCSGLGALRRRPEARWTKQAADIARLVPLQRTLARACFRALKPGGHLFYVTCSPVIEETTGLVEWLAEAEKDLELLDTGAMLDSVSQVSVPASKMGTAVQLWPHRHNTDAMFIQAIRRAPEARL